MWTVSFPSDLGQCANCISMYLDPFQSKSSMSSRHILYTNQSFTQHQKDSLLERKSIVSYDIVNLTGKDNSHLKKFKNLYFLMAQKVSFMALFNTQISN